MSFSDIQLNIVDSDRKIMVKLKALNYPKTDNNIKQLSYEQSNQY